MRLRFRRNVAGEIVGQLEIGYGPVYQLVLDRPIVDFQHCTEIYHDLKESCDQESIELLFTQEGIV